MQLPSLVALRAFVVVGNTESVRRAGQELNVDHASVSRHIKALEERLGITLFRHDGRRMVLTEEGQRFHRKIRRAFEMMTEATAELDIHRRRRLGIFAVPGFAHRKLLPRLPDLESLMPDWQIELHTSLDEVSTDPRTVRIEIAFLDNPVSNGERSYELLAMPRIIPVANPRVRASWVKISRVEELLDLPVIWGDSSSFLQYWLSLNGVDEMRPRKGPNMPNMHLAIEAAIYGQGIALTNEVLIEDAFRNGDLMELLDTDTRFHGYYVSGPTPLWETPPLQLLRKWLLQLVQAKNP
ncbi:LysR family transcriptional regulator [Maricaulis maris]|uniref:LysR family transcriptional regulator n=1 Tax=Maricaulis maris TaxID=74318 RepID=UPI003A924A37